MSQTKTGADIKPTAEVRTDTGRIIVSVGEGYYEVYVDKVMQQPALSNDLTHEYPAEPGEHRVSVYSGGRFVFDQMVTVPAEGEAKEQPSEEQATEQPAEGPASSDTGMVSVSGEYMEQLAHELRDLADMLLGWLGK